MNEPMKAYKKLAADILILLLLVTLFYGFPFLKKYNFSPSSDALCLLLPAKVFFKETVLSGNVPLWNPYTFMGVPFAATFISSVFYPFNAILFLFKEISVGINYFTFLHLFLTAVFMYLFIQYGLHLTRWAGIFGAITWCFSGYIGAKLDHTVFISVSAWIPLLVLCFIKLWETGKIKYALFISLLIALQVLGGHPQLLYYTLIFLGFYLLYYIVFYREIILDERIYISFVFLVSILLGVCISAVQVFPSLSFSQDAVRAIRGYNYCTTFSFPPEYLIAYIRPYYLGTPAVGYKGEVWYGEVCVYVGIVSLLFFMVSFAVVRKKKFVIFYGIMIMLLALLAMGKYTPVYKLFYLVVPGFKSYRVPARFMLLVTFLISSLSAVGFDYLREKVSLYKGKRWAAAFIIGCVAVVFIDLYLFSKNQLFSLPCDVRVLNEKSRGGAFLTYNAKNCRIFQLMTEIDYTDYSNEVINARILTIQPNFNMLAKVETLYGYEEGLLPILRYVNFLKKFYKAFYTPYPDADLLGLMNVKYIMADKAVYGEDFDLVFPVQNYADESPFSFKIFENKKYYEKFYWLDDVKDKYDLSLFVSNPQIDNLLYSNKEKIDIRNKNYKENNIAENKSADIKITQISPGEYKIKKNAKKEGEIIFSCAYCKGWVIRYNKKEVPILQFNDIMGIFYAPKGVEEITVIYSPLSFKIGAFITVLSLIVLLVLFIIRNKFEITKRISLEK